MQAQSGLAVGIHRWRYLRWSLGNDGCDELLKQIRGGKRGRRKDKIKNHGEFPSADGWESVCEITIRSIT